MKRFYIPIVICSIIALGLGRSARSLNQQGNSLYKKGLYMDALSRYKQAQVTDPQNMIFDYNIGCAYYKIDSLSHAADAFLRLISSSEDDETREKSYFNLANTLFRCRELDASIEAYKQALRINPEDMDAKINLEFAQKTKEEQKQEEKEGEKKQEEEEKAEEKKESKGEEERKKEEAKAGQEQKLSEEEAKSLLNAIEEEEKKAKQQSQKSQQQGRVGVLRDW